MLSFCWRLSQHNQKSQDSRSFTGNDPGNTFTKDGVIYFSADPGKLKLQWALASTHKHLFSWLCVYIDSSVSFGQSEKKSSKGMNVVNYGSGPNWFTVINNNKWGILSPQLLTSLTFPSTTHEASVVNGGISHNATPLLMNPSTHACRICPFIIIYRRRMSLLQPSVLHRVFRIKKVEWGGLPLLKALLKLHI